MRFLPTDLPGVLVIEPDVYRDERGYFLESYQREKYRAGGVAAPFVQDNHTKSVYGTIRGLHLQLREPQGKLIRVIEGEVFDVAVDVRLGSPTFGRWVGVALSAETFRQCYVPPGCAHGFCVVSPTAQVEYKCTAVYDPASEIGIAWNDPTLAIRWPIATEPLLSSRDRHQPLLSEIVNALPAYQTTEV